MPDNDVAYLAQGKLYRGAGKTVESAFGRSLRDRAAQIHDRHAWKRNGSGAQFMYGLILPAIPASSAWRSPACARGGNRGDFLYARDR